MPSLRVSELFVYPVKSARGIALTEAIVGDRGIEHDRRFMIVDADGRFLTQREHPTLALLETRIHDDTLTLHAPQHGTLDVPLRPTEGSPRQVKVWRSTCEAIVASEASAPFFSDLLGTAAELVYMPESSVRLVNPAYAHAGERVGFADACPFLVLTRASLDALNQRLPVPVTMDRFRPNIVVQGAAPHDEDAWPAFTVGPIRFHPAKPCERCMITTVDQATARRGDEPLRTLATYRKQDGAVLFGQYFLHRGEGPLRVGDPLHLPA